jgi:citrate lyase synthetase
VSDNHRPIIAERQRKTILLLLLVFTYIDNDHGSLLLCQIEECTFCDDLLLYLGKKHRFVGTCILTTVTTATAFLTAATAFYIATTTTIIIIIASRMTTKANIGTQSRDRQNIGNYSVKMITRMMKTTTTFLLSTIKWRQPMMLLLPLI